MYLVIKIKPKSQRLKEAVMKIQNVKDVDAFFLW